MSSCFHQEGRLSPETQVDNGVVRRLLGSEGILATRDVFSADEVKKINAVIGPIFVAKSMDKRAYAHPDELFGAGLWDLIFSARMRAILFSMMPDPVLYHCHIYEIAGDNPEPHIFGESLAGWHCDVEKRKGDLAVADGSPTHVSVFVYLTDVASENGAFEFLSARANQWLWPGTPYISVHGTVGYTFVWNREFFHRASPNLSKIRRRLLKLSVQRNRFPSSHLSNEHFKRVLQAIPPGDTAMDILLGRYQGQTAPTAPTTMPVPWTRVLPNANLKIPIARLLIPQLRKRLSRLKARLIISGTPDNAALRG